MYKVFVKGSKFYIKGKDQDFEYSDLAKNVLITQNSQTNDDFYFQNVNGWYPTKKVNISDLFDEGGNAYTKDSFISFIENKLGKGNGGTSGASIAEDMYFDTTAERDTFTTNNPDRLFEGVTCAVKNGANFDYYQYDTSSKTWLKANLIFQGEKGEKGEKGDAGGGLVKVGFTDEPSNTEEVEFMLFNKENFNLAVEGSGQNGKAEISIKNDGRGYYNIIGDDTGDNFTITSDLTQKYNYFNVLTRKFFEKFTIILDPPINTYKEFILNTSDFGNRQPFLQLNGEEVELIFGMQMIFKPNIQNNQWEFYITRVPFYVYDDPRYLDGTNEVWDIESGNRTAAISRGTLSNWIPEINGKRGMVMVHLMGLKSKDSTPYLRGRTFLYNILLDDGSYYHFVRTSNGDTIKDKKLRQIYIDPKEGFKLNHDGIIYATLQDGTQVDLIKAASDAPNLLFGDTKSSVILETKDGKAYVSNGLEVKKILVEGDEPSSKDPSEGFDLNTGKKINLKDGASINLESGGDITFDFNGENHNLIQTDSNGIVIGSNQSNANVELRTNGGEIKAQIGGSEENLAFESNTLGDIIAGSNITINKDDPRNPVISSTGGSGRSFTIDKDNPLEVKANDGSLHDTIAINSTDDLVIGTRSETIKSLHLATGTTEIGVYRKDEETGEEIVDRVLMASELDKLKGLDDYFIEADKLDGQIMKGVHPETGEEVFAGVDDVFMWTYHVYAYMLPLSFVARKGSVSMQAGTIIYNSQTNTFILNALGASSVVDDLGYTIGGGASAIKGNETVPISYNNILTSENTIDNGVYQFTGASKADLFTFQWNKYSSSSVTIPLAIVPDGGSYTVEGTNGRVKLINRISGYGLQVSSTISELGFMGYTVGYNQGSNNITLNKGRNKSTLYIRGSEYSITEDDIQKDIFIQAEPFVVDSYGHYSLTLNFPTIDVFKKYYYIPTLNEDQKNNLPHIMNLNIQVWIDPEEGRKDKEHRVYLRSNGDSIAWETSTKIGDTIGAYIRRPPNDNTRSILYSFNFMKIHESASDIGNMAGYTAQTAEADNVFSLDTVPPAPELNVNEALNIKLIQNNEGHVYAGLNREVPVKTSEEIDNLQLIKVIRQDDSLSLPIVSKCVVGDLASGFSLCEDNTPADTEILQIASGKYQLSVTNLIDNDRIGEYVYIDSDGKLTLNKTEFVVGWIIKDGVIIDVDIYNAHINSSSIDAFDVLTTRVLNIHEGADNPDKLSEYSIDGNFNHNEKLVGSPHIYVKDKDTGDLTQSYQILTDGSVDFKQKILSPVLELLNTNESALKNTILRVDGLNQNTVLESVGAFYLKQFNKNTGVEELSLLVDTTGRFDFKNAIRTLRIQNQGGWSSNSNTDDSGFIDFSTLGEVTIGSKDKISLAVSGKKINITPDFIDFSDTGLGNLRNVGLVSRNDSHDKNSIALNNAEIVYKTDLHTFRSGDNVEYINFSSAGLNLKNNNIKHIRHLVGNSVGSMFVANVNLIKRNDGENDKNSIALWDGTIQNFTNNFKVINHLTEEILTVDSAQLNVHGNQIKELAEGTEDTDAVNYGQIKGFDNIPYLRKFDSTGGDIYAHSYPEGRVQSWINYKGNGVDDLRIDSMRNGSSQQYDQIVVDNQSANICKLRLFYNGSSTLLRIMPKEIVQCYTNRDFARWKWIYGTESSPNENSSFLIEENNDEIITPNKGNTFSFIDSSKIDNYGNNGFITYLAPVLNESQNQSMLNNLDISKSWFIHKEINTTQGFLMLHESYVSDIYNKDVTGINNLSMLFGTDSRGRLGKSNQNTPEGYKLNWNGEYIPDTEDVNTLNPVKWIDKDGNVTENWSNSIKSPCYSIGTLANNSSASLQRGNVIYKNVNDIQSTIFEIDNNSEFFVLPVKAGGGTFNQIKVFPFFQSRKSQVIKEDAYTFNKSSDAIGTLLSIAYDSAVEQQNITDSIDKYMLNLGLSTGNLFVNELKVI